MFYHFRCKFNVNATQLLLIIVEFQRDYSEVSSTTSDQSFAASQFFPTKTSARMGTFVFTACSI